jgi:uncharacterized protein YjbJ (UPF0337 family)
MTSSTRTDPTEEVIMGSRFDEAKGRVKEAAGDLTNDRDMKAEGKADRAGAKVKELAEDAKERVERGVDAVKDRMDRDDRT